MLAEDAFIATIAVAPDDVTVRLVYADWLQERGRCGAEYLRTEAALARTDGSEARNLRRKLLEIIPRLPTRWRDRFEQPDLLLIPPVPFALGWYSVNADTPIPYRSLPNLNPDLLSPDLPWLSVKHPGMRLDQAAYEREELTALAQVQARASRLKLMLPPGFELFARDFPRRREVSLANTYFEFFLHDAGIFGFPQVGDGYLISFFGDMNYGNPHQHVWSLYLVPSIAWHCVVVFELPDDDPERPPDDPDQLLYCAPSFQVFLYRWWLRN